MPPDAPGPDQSAALAKRIMVAWANRGFRNSQGHFLSLSEFTCDDTGKPYAKRDAGAELALILGRGVVYSVQAQDLLQGLTRDEREVYRDHKWWAISDIARSNEQFFPKNLGSLLTGLGQVREQSMPVNISAKP